MIEKVNGKFELTCDECGRVHSSFTYQDAYDYGEEMGWTVFALEGNRKQTIAKLQAKAKTGLSDGY